jgi:hypothetical protein
VKFGCSSNIIIILTKLLLFFETFFNILEYVYICPNETMVGLEMFTDPTVPSDKILVGMFTQKLTNIHKE